MMPDAVDVLATPHPADAKTAAFAPATAVRHARVPLEGLMPVAHAASPAYDTTARCISDLKSLEGELVSGLSAAWSRVVDDDPLASVFQSPAWCVPWYRCYHDEYEPYVILVEAREGLVGLVPLAVHRSTREVTFASNTMSDYRDIVALPGYRRAVVEQLIACYLAGRFPNSLQIGWTDPASDTPALVADVCRERRLPSAVHHHPCWRWFPAEGEDLNKKFSRIKTHLNYFKRQGDIAFDVITQADDWVSFRDEFFRQHSLRQLQAGREVSFDDPRKRALYDQLFDSTDARLHVTAFRAGGRVMAGHVGLIWRDVLLFGAPSIRIEVEQRSPAVILLSWIVRNAAELGLAGFDLTIGDSEFKRRLGNQRVELTMTEIYGRRRGYYAYRARTAAVAAVKSVATSLWGEDAWQGRIKPAAAALVYKRERLAELGVVGTVAHGLRRLGRAVRQRPGPLVYSGVQDVPAPKSLAGYQLHENAVEDLLYWDGNSPSISRAITGCASSFARSLSAGHTLHTLIVGDSLAAWCYSRSVTAEQPSHAVAGESTYERGAVVIYGVYALPAFRVPDVYRTLVSRVAHVRLARGAPRVYLVTTDADTHPALRRAARDARFRVSAG